MLGSLLGEFNGFFIIKQIEKFECALFCFKALRKRLEHSRSGRNTRLSLVFLPTLLSCFSHSLRDLQQSTVKVSLFVK